MINQFIKINPTLGGSKWINVDNIVAIEEDKSGGKIKIITNAKRDDHPVSYTVKTSVEDFLSAIGCTGVVL